VCDIIEAMIKRTVVAFLFTISLTFCFIFVAFSSWFAPKADAVFDCLTLTPDSSSKDKQDCQAQLNDLERQLAELTAKQNIQKGHAGTLKGDLNILGTQISALQAKVKARSLAIVQLKVNITEKVKAINSLSSKIEREHESLAKLLRNTNKFDNENVVHLILSDSDLSNFYSDLESYASIKQAIKDSVDNIKGVKKQTEVAKEDLEKKQNAETDAKAELESAKTKVVKTEDEKKKLLSITNDSISEYEKQKAQKAAEVARIRAALFPLANANQKIEFGTAVLYATEAQKLTGVDPAFLLSILTQESNLGSNVGQCYLTNQQTGEGVGKNTGTPFSNVMKAMGKPGRKGDVDDFLRITSKLGLVWSQTAISCPIAGVAGYGGAMGPAQFIPTTWAIFENRLKNILGRDANPWGPRDAFLASAMYLTDLGAIGNSASAQSSAACRYYGSGGASCSYSKSVMKIKEGIQSNLDLLSS